MEEPSWTDEDRLTFAALLAGLQSDDLICCYGGRVTQDRQIHNLIDLSINVLFNLISASGTEKSWIWMNGCWGLLHAVLDMKNSNSTHPIQGFLSRLNLHKLLIRLQSSSLSPCSSPHWSSGNHSLTTLGMSLRKVSHEAFVFCVISRNQGKMKPLTWQSVRSEALQSL